MKSFQVWILSLSLIFASHLTRSFADDFQNSNVKVNCYQDKAGGYWWNYCVHAVDGSTNRDVLYYFHGINGSEYEWQYSPMYSKIYNLWRTRAPTVISISYGYLWLLAEKNTSGYSGLYEQFTKTALPTIESERNIHPARRMLMGLSMGGFNAAQVYLKNPELFAKVGLACPAISPVNPFSTTKEITDYINRTHAYSNYVYNALSLSQTYFPTLAAWKTGDSIELAKTLATPLSPPLYVSGGLQDQYGFFDGASQLVAVATANGARATWVPLPGRHCTFDWEGTAKFFVSP